MAADFQNVFFTSVIQPLALVFLLPPLLFTHEPVQDPVDQTLLHAYFTLLFGFFSIFLFFCRKTPAAFDPLMIVAFSTTLPWFLLHSADFSLPEDRSIWVGLYFNNVCFQSLVWICFFFTTLVYKKNKFSF